MADVGSRYIPLPCFFGVGLFNFRSWNYAKGTVSAPIPDQGLPLPPLPICLPSCSILACYLSHTLARGGTVLSSCPFRAPLPPPPPGTISADHVLSPALKREKQRKIATPGEGIVARVGIKNLRGGEHRDGDSCGFSYLFAVQGLMYRLERRVVSCNGGMRLEEGPQGGRSCGILPLKYL